MVQQVFYGETNTLTAAMTDITMVQKLVLGFLVVMIFAMGLFPQPVIDLTRDAVSVIFTRFK